MKTHTEDGFEKLIVEHLVLDGGYEPRGFDPTQASYDPDEALAVQAGYDVQRALISAEVIGLRPGHPTHVMGQAPGHPRRRP